LAQTLPQPPQLLGSFWVFTQRPRQQVSPALAHAPGGQVPSPVPLSVQDQTPP
jgi:hypothetical protein